MVSRPSRKKSAATPDMATTIDIKSPVDNSPTPSRSMNSSRKGSDSQSTNAVADETSSRVNSEVVDKTSSRVVNSDGVDKISSRVVNSDGVDKSKSSIMILVSYAKQTKFNRNLI